MVRPGVRVAAGVMAAVLVGAGCGAPPVEPEQALAAFRALISRDDVTYRFELVVLSDGTADGRGSTHAIGAVAGRDSAYRLTLGDDPSNPAEATDTVIVGDGAFRRSGTLRWEATSRPEGFAGGDLAVFLPLIGSAQLTVVGRVDFEGASRVQLANAAPIAVPSREGGQPELTRLELLIADDGTPIRAVAEFNPGGGGTDRPVIEFRFADFGAEILIQPPVIP